MNHSKAHYLNIETYFAIEHLWPAQKKPHVTLSIPHHYMLWVIDEGELHVKINAKQWTLHSGDAFFAPRRQTRHLHVPTGAHWWSLDFLPYWFNDIDPLQSVRKPVVWSHHQETDELRQLMELLSKRWMASWNKGPLRPELLSSYFQELPDHRAAFSPEEQLVNQGLAQAIFGRCLEKLSQSKVAVHLHESLPPLLQRALNFIEENPKLSIEELSRQVGFSPVQLRRMFHYWLGLSPRQYLLQQRMDKARLLLETTSWTVSAIAESVGFSSISSFARAFKSIYGVAPLELRQNSRKSATQKMFSL
jgi:AraC-like DNA-binding protein